MLSYRIEFLHPDNVISIIAESMMSSASYWKQAVIYKPNAALMQIMSAHLLSIDEPNVRLSKENQQLVNAYSEGSDDFLKFRTMSNIERKALVDDFLHALGDQQLVVLWTAQHQILLDDWRPWAVDDLMYAVIDQWQAYRNARCAEEIKATLMAHHIDLQRIYFHPVLQPLEP